MFVLKPCLLIILQPCLNLSVGDTLRNDVWSVSRCAPSFFPFPTESMTQNSGQTLLILTSIRIKSACYTTALWHFSWFLGTNISSADLKQRDSIFHPRAEVASPLDVVWCDSTLVYSHKCLTQIRTEVKLSKFEANQWPQTTNLCIYHRRIHTDPVLKDRSITHSSNHPNRMLTLHSNISHWSRARLTCSGRTGESSHFFAVSSGCSLLGNHLGQVAP